MVKQLKLDRIPIIKHWDSALELLDKDNFVVYTKQLIMTSY